MQRFIAIFLLSAAVCHGGAIFREGATWRYYKGTNAPAAGWTNVVFDETGWLGPSPGGFGYDSDDSTELSDMSNSYVSVFTRKTFSIADTASVTRLTMAADFDDGFVAYINGQEVYRSNMPSGSISFQTNASGSHESSRGSNGAEKVFIALSPSFLQNGSNLIAVSGHNNASNSSDFSLLIELYTNLTLVRGPILSLQHDNRITVSWRTDALTDSVIDYGFSTNYEAGTVSNGVLVRQHVLELPVLAPGSSYFYRVKSDGISLAEKIFRSPPGSSQSFRFAVIGDFGTPYTDTRAVANRLGLQNPDLLLTVGDNVYPDGQVGGYDECWFTPYTQTISRVPMMPLIGDHEIRTFAGAPFTNYLYLPTNGATGLIERCYSFDFGNARFVALDNLAYNPATLNVSRWPVIENWVSNNLATTTQQWKFVYLHIPPFVSSGLHDEDPNTITRLTPIFERCGVDVVFGGDSHFFERSNPRAGVRYVITGGGGASLYPISSRRPYSSAVYTTLHSFVYGDVSGTVFRLRCMNLNGTVVDEFVYDQAHPFRMDGLLDSTNWVRVSNSVTISAAIRSNFLYLASRDAGEGSDHFIYLSDRLTTNRPAGGGKVGTVMQWNAFMVDENEHGERDWYNAAGQRITNGYVARSETYGHTNLATCTNFLEGSLDLFHTFTNFPPRLYAAAAGFTSPTNGGLVLALQAPTNQPGGSGSNIESNEFFGFNTRDIAIDLPVANAGSNQSVEAGVVVALDASGSQSPSGYALSFAWSQVSGPMGLVAEEYMATQNVAEATNATLQLIVNDTRFDSTGTVIVTVLPMVDTDGDGLSDGEEATGVNNIFTPIDPAGQLSNPALSDSDGDGMGDGLEALAGTDAMNGLSLFTITETQTSFGSNLVVTWNSVSNRNYSILAASNLLDAFNEVAANIPAAPPLNAYTVPVEDAAQMYFIRTGQ